MKSKMPWVFSLILIIVLAFVFASLQKIPFFAFMSAFTLCYIPFLFLLSASFRIIQIPFALIGRWAVYVCLLAETYFFTQFFHAMVQTGISSFNLSKISLLLFFSFLILTTLPLLFNGANSKRESAFLYALFSACLSIVLLFTFTYTEFFAVMHPISWSISLSIWLSDLPLIGSIISSLSLPLFFVILLYSCLTILSVLSTFRKKKPLPPKDFDLSFLEIDQ